MGRRAKDRPVLEVQVSFEPTRLSRQWLAEAYDQLVPSIRRRTAPDTGRGAAPATVRTKRR